MPCLPALWNLKRYFIQMNASKFSRFYTLYHAHRLKPAHFHMPFPESALLPKHRLSEATSDGRGCLVCILDTGVDPSAPNLQVTSTGTRKLIDIVDCSGSGDVTLSTPCMASPSTEEIKGTSPSPLKIVGLSGRTLTLPADAWGNSSSALSEEQWTPLILIDANCLREIPTWAKTGRGAVAKDCD